jgi:3-hydroxymyristoyl/3-hydroxydecanoyl-(acyl carrier protein) dehydratase
VSDITYAEFEIGPDHPALPGHFPGNPVVPGVLILQEVMDGALRLDVGGTIKEVVQVKFVSMLKPEQRCQIEYRPGRDGRVRFECQADGRVIANGLLKS